MSERERSKEGHTHSVTSPRESRLVEKTRATEHSRSETACPSARGAVRFYSRRLQVHAKTMGRSLVVRSLAAKSSCPRHQAHVLQRKARAWRLRAERWVSERTLRDFEVRPGNRAWHRAVEEVQRAYPQTKDWLLSCSSSEGGWGRWVPNSQGSGVGGWLQMFPSTFWRMFTAARVDVRARGYRVPASAASWYSPLGQALGGAWAIRNGRRHEWVGAGC